MLLESNPRFVSKKTSVAVIGLDSPSGRQWSVFADASSEGSKLSDLKKIRRKLSSEPALMRLNQDDQLYHGEKVLTNGRMIT